MDGKEKFRKIWEFIRGDMPTTDFEKLLYSDPSFENYLGKELYFRSIENNYKDSGSNLELRDLLKARQHETSPTNCKCIELSNLSIIDMGEETTKIFKTLVQIKKRGEPYWWLALSQCKECQQYWLTAEESRQNDVDYLLRVDKNTKDKILDQDTWPQIFNTYENLLRIGKNAWKRVSFAEPLNAKSLRWTIEDVAKEHPGIKISQLAELLNLDLPTAATIAKEVVNETNVNINFDKPNEKAE